MHRLAFVFLLVLLSGCNKPLHTGSVTVSESEDPVAMAGVHRDGQLVYAFAWPLNVPKIDTNDPAAKPSNKGIHFLSTSPDGLWISGKKVAIPQSSKVFALLANGDVVPITLTEAELQEVTTLTQPNNYKAPIPNGPLKDKLLAPFKAKAVTE
jgi:hypothetical protein